MLAGQRWAMEDGRRGAVEKVGENEDDKRKIHHVRVNYRDGESWLPSE